ncbi:MAG: rhomboid family intramembrane serine protease [Chloroflexi bacterium]|nr:rhomboid family intramembrane serine protease [Chloroflexota bacterium]
MIPVTDTVRSRSVPFVNVAIILACIGVFVYELTLSAVDINAFFLDYGVIPREITDWVQSPSGLREPSTVITSAFVHGGWLHLIGNMLYLWVFGDNVEDALGHVWYALFYVLAAAGAVAVQVAVDTNEFIPMIGASGAIAGVLGAYLVLYPRATVGAVIPLLWFFGPIPMPAVLLIGFWFLMQVFAGAASIGGDATGVSEGVAVFAHIGGFVFGFVVVLALRPMIKRRPYESVKRRRRRDVW